MAPPFPVRQGPTLLPKNQNGSKTDSGDLVAPMLKKKERREGKKGRGREGLRKEGEDGGKRPFTFTFNSRMVLHIISLSGAIVEKLELRSEQDLQYSLRACQVPAGEQRRQSCPDAISQPRKQHCPNRPEAHKGTVGETRRAGKEWHPLSPSPMCSVHRGGCKGGSERASTYSGWLSIRAATRTILKEVLPASHLALIGLCSQC